MKTSYWPLAFILVAGIAAALWFAQRSGPQESGGNADVALLTSDYDYYIQDMQTTRFGADGKAVSLLQAQRVTHYPEGDRAVLQAPRFSNFGADNAAWQVSAETGTLAPDAERAEDRLELQGDVILNKPRAVGDFVEVRTEALTVYADTEEALTAEPVSVRTRRNRVDGIGMQALLAQDYINLNNGRGTHDPTRDPTRGPTPLP